MRSLLGVTSCGMRSALPWRAAAHTAHSSVCAFLVHAHSTYTIRNECGRGGSGDPGPFRASRLLRHPDRKGPATRLEVADAFGTETFTQLGTGPLELNLFEDPTGGLAAGPAEELTMTEVEAQVRLMVSAYDRHVFYLMYTPLVDVVQLVVENGLLPQSAECRGTRSSNDGGGTGEDALSGAPSSRSSAASTPSLSSYSSGASAPLASARTEKDEASSAQSPSIEGSRVLRKPEEVMADWFADGLAVMKSPRQATAGQMGQRRWQLLSAALDKFYEPIAAVMPLTRVVRRHRLPESLHVGFLRQLAMSLVEEQSRRRTIATLPGLVLGLANGRAPAVLQLPEDHDTRVLLVGELLLGVAQETGNTDVAYLGVQLLRANGLIVPFAFQKQLTNVFSMAARLQTDWQTRSTGRLAPIYPRWLEYFRQVRQDNADRLRARHAAERSGTDRDLDSSSSRSDQPKSIASHGDTGDAHDRGGSHEQHEYFTSRRPADMERVASLEANIDAALQSRASLLEAEVLAMQRRRQRRQQQQQQRSLHPGSFRAPHGDVGANMTEEGNEEVEVEAERVRASRSDRENGKGDRELEEEAVPRKRHGRTLQAKRTKSAKRPRKDTKTLASCTAFEDEKEL